MSDAPHEVWGRLTDAQRDWLRETYNATQEGEPRGEAGILADGLEGLALVAIARDRGSAWLTTLGRAVAIYGRTAHWELCERCGRQLEPGKEVMLELNSATGEYAKGLEPGDAGPHGDTTVHGEDSQGGFYFGAACARIVLRTEGWHDGMTTTDERDNRRVLGA